MTRAFTSILIPLLLVWGGSVAAAQSPTPRARDFRESCDSLGARLERRTSVCGEVELKKVLKRGGELDFYFSDKLSWWPWRSDDLGWFRSELEGEMRGVCKGFRLGRIYSKGLPLDSFVMPLPTSSGLPVPTSFTKNDPRLSSGSRFIERVGAMRFPKGLSDRYISLWQSHGRYFDDADSLWRWQRATLHRTVEDMYTQSYVLELLMPMLENAGAYVMTPRERDIQRHEVVCDGDPAFSGPREEDCRRFGQYSESGRWSDAGRGFADAKRTYDLTDNPFTMGHCRKTVCNPAGGSQARWTPDIPERGRYAVYISYVTTPASSTKARYTVTHLGGSTEFLVNQKRGGGTWIYLGTFEFDAGTSGFVTLDNRGDSGDEVCADAVRFGGGMGKVDRGKGLSGMAASCEGALYSYPWYGVDESVWTEKDRDYTRDYFSRGNWEEWLRQQKGIPFDVSLAFHTDAGVTPNDSTVGTLAIHTLSSEGSTRYKDGTSRMAGRLLCDFVQTQVVDDIRSGFDPEWARRGLWNKSYAEARIPEVPSMLLELLSHQNFADMRLGLDPSFRFTVSRAVYKGLLKFLSARYSCEYAVQPLGVQSFRVDLEDGCAVLSWEGKEDPLEPTASPKGYLVQTRIDDGVFDEGFALTECGARVPLVPGHLYSFRITAWNDGGRSFPSQVLCAGIPAAHSTNTPVLIVNNFDRVSAPFSFDTPFYAGFDARKDSGVPYVQDISCIGDCYEFNRSLEWVSDDMPGFGACHSDRSGTVVAGNSFDFPAVHARSLLKLGVPVRSCSREAFCAMPQPTPSERCIVDLICGKQETTRIGAGRVEDRYEVFPEDLKRAIRSWSSAGCNFIISGSSIASDKSALGGFTSVVLGYSLAASTGTCTGTMQGTPRSRLEGTYHFRTSPNPDCYSIESPDGLDKADFRGRILLRYTLTNTPAAVMYSSPQGYKVFSVGTPIECLQTEQERTAIFRRCLSEMLL